MPNDFSLEKRSFDLPPEDRIKEEAQRLGFLDCGIAKAEFLEEEKEGLAQWLKGGMHGGMLYMENHFEKRLDPRELVENSRSVISVLLNYFPSQSQADPEAPVLSKYAYGLDYHFVLKDRLNQLLAYINDEIAPVSGRAFVDSAPVLDRAWARKAGLGWVGKNSNLISHKHGSFFFIGELLVDLELKPDQPENKDHCGTCTRCIDACPAGAIVAPRVIDARRCISYLTIENRGEIPSRFSGKLKNRFFGCDICQDVCPWNRKATPHNIEEFAPSAELMQMSNDEWFHLDRNTFNRLFKKSPLKRAGYKLIIRNLNFLQK